MTEEQLKAVAVDEVTNMLVDWTGTMDIAANLSVHLCAVRNALSRIT
jgi:hypothetical protein